MSDERQEIDYGWQIDIPIETQAALDHLTQYCLNDEEWHLAVERNGMPLPLFAVPPSEPEYERRRAERSAALSRGEPDPFKASVLESRMPPFSETDEQRAAREARQLKRSARYWQRFHERRERRILDAILGTAEETIRSMGVPPELLDEANQETWRDRPPLL